MKTVFRFILVAALVALGVWLWFVLFPSPEKIIRQRLTELARTASFTSGESDLARLAAAQNLAGFFATNVEVNIDVPGRVQHRLLGRDEIKEAALGAHSTLRGLKVQFPDINITVAPDKHSAVADLTVEANVAGEHDSIVQEMKFTFQQTDDGWLITRIETVRTLSSVTLRFALRRAPFIVTA
ncbi:MAG: hypothetical protein ABSD57_03115 [Verrucomicrobiota bacterium]|jgi:hypothetical protein